MCALKYDVIYADPPWSYSFSKSKSRAIESHYKTMKVADICNMAVPSAENSVLYLWATAPKLLDAIKVMSSWGFTYKTNCVWDKRLLGMGYWFRGQHELLLVGVKGKFSPPAPPLRLGSVFSIKRTRHSKKPDYIRDCISSWFCNANKLELFARSKAHGWHSWGNEINSDIKLSAQETIVSGLTSYNT